MCIRFAFCRRTKARKIGVIELCIRTSSSGEQRERWRSVEVCMVSGLDLPAIKDESDEAARKSGGCPRVETNQLHLIVRYRKNWTC